MSKVDDELTRRLHRAERPVDGSAVFEGLERRRSHHERVRRVQAALLAFAVLAATVGGFVSLSRVFRDRQATGSANDGRIVFARAQLAQLEQLPGSAATGHGFEIWSMAADGTDLRPVISDRVSATTPVWSPDGSRIAFLDKDTHAQGLGTLRLLSSEADGSDVTVIAEGLAEPLVRALAWSPDGTRIAVLDTKGHDLDSLDEFGLPRAEIAVYALNGSREALVNTPGTAGGFAWSPDGQGFTVARIPAASDSPLTGVDLVQVDLQGGVLGLLAENVSLYPPAWSPDGSRIAFVRRGPLASGSDVRGDDVWTVNADGSDEERLTEDGGRKPSLAWTPDGARILYSSQMPDSCSIVLIRPDGSGRTVVADRSMMGGCAQEISVPPAVTSMPPSPSPDTSPAATSDARDIGLGVAMCDLQVLGGIDWDGTGIHGAAWTGAPVDEDGRCSSAADVQHVVAVDRDGDGIADQGSTSIRSCLLCRPFDTLDLNNDGVLELVVLEEASSTPTYSLYEVNRPGSERALGVYPIFVVPPGAPAMNLDPNEPTRFMVGGDEGFSGSIACENEGPGSPMLRYTWIRGAVDADTELRVDVTKLSFGEDGVFHIESVDRFSVPRNPEPTDLKSTEPACGVDFHPAA
jgi:Tol biopolymer transport system component